jgi:hypothetical protein
MARDFLLNFGSIARTGTTTTLPNVVDVGPTGVNGTVNLFVRVVVNLTGATGTGFVQFACEVQASKEPTSTISTGTWTTIAATPSDVTAYRAPVTSGVVTEGAVVMFIILKAPAGSMATANYTVGGIPGVYAEDNYTRFRVRVLDSVSGASAPVATYSASIVSAADGTLA